MPDYFVFYRLMFDTGMELQDPTMRLQYFEAVINYGLNGILPNDPVMKALIKGAVFSIDKFNSRREKISDGMMGNSNALKTWEKVSKQMETDGNRGEQIKQISLKRIEGRSIEDKKEEENKNKKEKYMDFVFLTETEHSRLVEKFGLTKTNYWIDRLNSYIGQIGTGSASKRYKSHYFTILNRDRREGGKSSGDFAKEQALANHRKKIREQIDEYFSSNESDDVGSEQKTQAFDRRGEVLGS